MRPRGFTLIEVLVTMLVATVGVASLCRSAQAILKSRMLAERLSEISRLAERTLEEMLATDATTLTPQDLFDEVPGRRELLRRRRRIEPGPRENLWHLAVTVTSSTGREISLHTLLRRPWF